MGRWDQSRATIAIDAGEVGTVFECHTQNFHPTFRTRIEIWGVTDIIHRIHVGPGIYQDSGTFNCIVVSGLQ